MGGMHCGVSRSQFTEGGAATRVILREHNVNLVLHPKLDQFPWADPHLSLSMSPVPSGWSPARILRSTSLDIVLEVWLQSMQSWHAHPGPQWEQLLFLLRFGVKCLS